MWWGKRLGITIAVLLVSSVAAAEPAGNTGFVPISLEHPDHADSVLVEPGDHLWKISQTHLEQELGRVAGPAEVAPYWRAVIQANRARLRSGDPDLIYPGEVIALPPGG